MTPTTAYEITCGKVWGTDTELVPGGVHGGSSFAKTAGRSRRHRSRPGNPGGGDWLRNKQRKPHGGDSVRLSRFVRSDLSDVATHGGTSKCEQILPQRNTTHTTQLGPENHIQQNEWAVASAAQTLLGRVSPNALAVALALAAHVPFDGSTMKVWPSRQRLLFMCRIGGRSTLSRVLEELEGHGLIEVGRSKDRRKIKPLYPELRGSAKARCRADSEGSGKGFSACGNPRRSWSRNGTAT